MPLTIPKHRHNFSCFKKPLLVVAVISLFGMPAGAAAYFMPLYNENAAGQHDAVAKETPSQDEETTPANPTSNEQTPPPSSEPAKPLPEPTKPEPTIISEKFKLYVDPNNPAAKQAAAWRATRPDDATLLEKLGAQPQARWFGGWNKPNEATDYVEAATLANAMPVLVLYNIPLRHCSSGGAANQTDYIAWIKQMANSIGTNPAMVILEPDALALVSCLSPTDQALRYQSISKAVEILKAHTNTKVYIDAGHGNWVGDTEMANRLTKAYITKADGFSLNVANFIPTDINQAYGDRLAAKLPGKTFVIDTGRNGLGPDPDAKWCNPQGRAAGKLPTTATADPNLEAYLWIKPLGESDGTCNGGPDAGQWWAEYALGLMQRAKH